MTELQLKMYKNFLKYGSVYGPDIKKMYNRQVQCRKICCHPYIFPNIEDSSEPLFGDHLIIHSGKMKVLDKLLEKFLNEGHKVLIFSQFTSLLTILEDYLHYRNYGYCKIDGSSQLSQRQ